MKRVAWKSLAVPLAFILAMGVVGQALAWQYNQAYIASSLYGGANGKPWSPYNGYLRGDVFQLSNRVAVAQGDTVRWNSTALSYITSHGQYVYITFHSFNINNGCSSFRADSVGWASNLPSPFQLVLIRLPCTTRYTEMRIGSNSQVSIAAYTSYWGKGQYTEETSTSLDQKISVDTYYGGNENYHQVYCIRVGQVVAVVC
ncbi:MAG: hypothetical protein MN733_43105 [Nitrososphaera sp.]|nr:hypothetical protein [Nitrososphaera sp.]